jgi:hypothetical protein
MRPLSKIETPVMTACLTYTTAAPVAVGIANIEGAMEFFKLISASIAIIESTRRKSS